MKIEINLDGKPMGEKVKGGLKKFWDLPIEQKLAVVSVTTIATKTLLNVVHEARLVHREHRLSKHADTIIF